jgi:hypothetical protein
MLSCGRYGDMCCMPHEMTMTWRRHAVAVAVVTKILEYAPDDFKYYFEHREVERVVSEAPPLGDADHHDKDGDAAELGKHDILHQGSPFLG